MKLAVNYSLPSAAQRREGLIQFDYFKCPPWPGMIADAHQVGEVTVHFELRAGTGRLHESNWDEIEHWLAHTSGTRYVNLHLTPTTRDFTDIPAACPEAAQRQQVIEQLLADVQAVTRRFGPENVIAENVPYLGPDRNILAPAGDPAVIGAILAETGCGLLLDISHARLCAHYLGLNERQYIESLPVERVRELHFTGIQMRDGRPQDHLPAVPADWPVLGWVLERVQSGQWGHPWMLAFEYGGLGEFFAQNSDPEAIAAQVPELYRRVAGVNGAHQSG